MTNDWRSDTHPDEWDELARVAHHQDMLILKLDRETNAATPVQHRTRWQNACIAAESLMRSPAGDVHAATLMMEGTNWKGCCS